MTTTRKKDKATEPLDEKSLYASACRLWGYPAQWGMLIEECAELIVQVNKLHRGVDRATLIDELVDVSIMVEQAKYMLDLSDDDFKWLKERKLRRLKERIEA